MVGYDRWKCYKYWRKYCQSFCRLQVYWWLTCPMFLGCMDTQLTMFIHGCLLFSRFLLNILAFEFHGLAAALNTLAFDLCNTVPACHTYLSDSWYTTSGLPLDTSDFSFCGIAWLVRGLVLVVFCMSWILWHVTMVALSFCVTLVDFLLNLLCHPKWHLDSTVKFLTWWSPKDNSTVCFNMEAPNIYVATEALRDLLFIANGM